MRGVRWDKVYGTNLDQVGPKKANLDQLGQVGRRFAVFCLLGEAPLTNLDHTPEKALLKEVVDRTCPTPNHSV